MKYPMIRKNGRLSSSLAAVTSAALSAGLLHTSPIFAQADGSAYEEVVVTARKRDEKLLEIPLSMTAISASDIEDKGITELVDLVAFTPGFFFAEHSVGRADRSNRILVIRGMAISQENDHQQAATIFVDGIPALGSAMAGLEDLERVEVVRGPQSAYFGRSTFAGAVNFVT
jgi:iron complex outermembrane receptor protein